MNEKANVAIVKIGFLEIEGLLLPSGEFAITSRQFCQCITDDVPINPHQKVKEIIRSKVGQKLMPQGLQGQRKIKINHPSYGNQAVDIIQLSDFEKLLRIADRMDYEKATELVDILVGLSLQQLFSDAFEIEFNQQDRQQWLKVRQRGKNIRKTLTDAIKIYIERNKENLSNEYIKWIYAKCTDAIYLHLFNRRCKQLRELWNIDDMELFRNSLTEEELLWISEVEDIASRYIIEDNKEPLSTVLSIIKITKIPQSQRKFD